MTKQAFLGPGFSSSGGETNDDTCRHLSTPAETTPVSASLTVGDLSWIVGDLSWIVGDRTSAGTGDWCGVLKTFIVIPGILYQTNNEEIRLKLNFEEGAGGKCRLGRWYFLGGRDESSSSRFFFSSPPSGPPASPSNR